MVDGYVVVLGLIVGAVVAGEGDDVGAMVSRCYMSFLGQIKHVIKKQCST